MLAARTILMTTDTIGGVFTYSVELARALADHDVRILLATMGRPLTPAQRQTIDELENVKLFESSYKLEWMPDPWHDVQAAGDWLLSLEARYAPDLVHLNGYCHAALPWSAPALVVGHSCVLSWWKSVKGTDVPQCWRRYGEEVRRGLRAAELAIAPSSAMLSQLESCYGPLSQSLVIPNGRDVRRFAPGDKRKIIFTAGRLWDEAKNVQMLKTVAPRLKWPIYAAGEGYCSSDRNFRTVGALAEKEVAEWLSIASIYALPACYEPFGLTVLEAALSGCALVLGDIPSLRENWDGCAVFVSPNDPDALEEELSWLTRDEVRRRQLQRAAMKRALSFNTQRMAKGYLGAYAVAEQSRRLACA